MTAAKACQKCGAQNPGLICEYCGAMTVSSGDAESERAGLEEFCRLLPSKDAPAQAKLLETGYLPSHKSVLIDAGVRCVPLVRVGHSDVVAESALRRLETVILKLRLLSPDDDAKRAVAEFEGVVKKYQAEEARDTFWGMAVFGVLAVVIIFAAVWYAMRACR